MMRGAIPEDIPHSFFEGAERVLGANDEEWHILCWAYLEPARFPNCLGGVTSAGG
jgi:hypothetical protein